MKIGAVRRETRNGDESVSAKIEWEDADRVPVDLRCSFRGGDRPSGDPNVFLIATFFPALEAGERRIAVEGAICPLLRDGLRAAAAVIGAWHGANRAVPAIAPSEGFHPGDPTSVAGEGIYLSGGLDSLDLLLSRGAGLPREHPAAVRRAIFAANFTCHPEAAKVAELSARAHRAAAAMASACDLPLTVIEGNLLELHADFAFFSRISHGSVLGAMAQLFSGRLIAVALAASDDARSGLGPWGSHPLLDPLFGTSALRFVHDGIGASRAGKARRTGPTELARRHLFVCDNPNPGDPLPNCGRCEKCLRTMTELLVAGALAESETFPRDVEPERIRELPGVPPFRSLRYYWAPLAAAAQVAGRRDLADAIRTRLDEERRARSWHAERGWKGRLRRLDRRRLGGRLLALRRGLGGDQAP